MGNRLVDSATPYLRQHSADLVHWHTWDDDALELAGREGKPILLAIGYSACHWCHVLAEESFRDPDTATLMNAHFVNILVDREERPDLDRIYQAALAGLGERRGWPLTMFLTPGGEAFGGGTYFPREARDGRPGFRDVLLAMARAFAEAPDEAVARARKLTAALGVRPAGDGRGELSPAFVNYAADQLLEGIDVVYGGFGTSGPKFPSPMALELVWRAYLRTGRRSYRDAVLLSAEQMCRGGIYDALGGGFHRYATDDAWLVPHFEKMLYDNALLIDLLTLLWQEGRQPLFAQCVAETVGWALREMMTPEGGFAATLAADTAGYDGLPPGEGVFYLWRAEQIDALLADDAPLLRRHYDVQPGGNWEG